jgi:hypothetical protein
MCACWALCVDMLMCTCLWRGSAPRVCVLPCVVLRQEGVALIHGKEDVDISRLIKILVVSLVVQADAVRRELSDRRDTMCSHNPRLIACCPDLAHAVPHLYYEVAVDAVRTLALSTVDVFQQPHESLWDCHIRVSAGQKLEDTALLSSWHCTAQCLDDIMDLAPDLLVGSTGSRIIVMRSRRVVASSLASFIDGCLDPGTLFFLTLHACIRDNQDVDESPPPQSTLVFTPRALWDPPTTSRPTLGGLVAWVLLLSVKQWFFTERPHR